MKQRNRKRKIGSLLLAVTMIITLFPALSREVHATGKPDAGKFATAEQLKTFNTDDNDGDKNPAKVYFGKNNQEWWIAGSQGADSVTLFAASPLKTMQKFDENYNNNDKSTLKKTYSDDWNCSYSGEAPSEVGANHYGASSVRTILQGLETSCFSTAEQTLMQETTVYTKDIENNCVYSTTDKLYLAYGGLYREAYITVGVNASELTNLNSGLRIDKAYLESSRFWLRAPNNSDHSLGRLVDPDNSVMTLSIDNKFAVVPAFELNLSSVLFASAAKAASSEIAETGTITDGAAMTLRLDGSGKNIGTVSCDVTAGKIEAQKDASATGTIFLVVQGNDGTNDWYYSMPSGEKTVVTKNQIQEACSISDIDLAECKIWLETTEDNVVYAKEAKVKNFNVETTLKPGETVVRTDETISNAQNGTVTVDKGNDGTVDMTLRLPQAGNIHITADGRITIPAGGTVETEDGNGLMLPNGGTIDTYGDIEAEKIVRGDITITAPEGGTVTADIVGNITIPAGGTVDKEEKTQPTNPPIQPTNPPVNPSTKPTSPSSNPTTKPTEKPEVSNPSETVSPEEVIKNSEKLDSGVYARWKGNAFRLSWKAVQGAESYDIFAARCEKKLDKKSFVKTVKGNKKSVSLKKIAGKKISRKKNYKFRIQAWKYIGGKKVYIGSSKTYHVAGKKHRKYTNAKKLRPAKKKYTLKKGKKVRLKVRIVKQSKKKKLLPKSYGPELWYFSSNKKVAAVTSKGKVKAKKKGTCYIYATALNGIRVKIKIRVK